MMRYTKLFEYFTSLFVAKFGCTLLYKKHGEIDQKLRIQFLLDRLLTCTFSVDLADMCLDELVRKPDM